MCNDILEVFWVTYEDKAWKGLIDIADNPDTTENVDTFALQTINSVIKSEVVKRWQEQVMNLLPVVQQHQMVPFHDRFLNMQFKEEENIEKMKERLIERVGQSSQNSGKMRKWPQCWMSDYVFLHTASWSLP